MKKIPLLTSLFLASLPLCFSASESLAGPLPYRVVIEKEEAEEGPLKQIKEALVLAGVAAPLAAESLKAFDGYIDKRIDEKKKVTLYSQAIADITQAAAKKGWSGADISSLLIYCQKEIDGEGRSATRLKTGAVAEIIKGKNIKEVTTFLEATEGPEDDDDD